MVVGKMKKKIIELERNLREVGKKGFPSYVVPIPKIDLLVNGFDTKKKVKVRIEQ